MLCLIKTRPAVFERARDRILELHPYDVPEILAFAVDDGSPDYLDWLKRSSSTARLGASRPLGLQSRVLRAQASRRRPGRPR